MTLKFIKKVTSEGKRRVINIPKKYHEEVNLGDDMMISKPEYDKMNEEELREILKTK